MIDLSLISKSSGISLLTFVLGTSIMGVSVSTLTLAVSVAVAFGGLVYGFGKLNQKITDLQSDVQLIKGILLNKEDKK